MIYLSGGKALCYQIKTTGSAYIEFEDNNNNKMILNGAWCNLHKYT